MTRIEEALHLATIAHKGQLDKIGNPYIEHPKAVAEYIIEKYKKQFWPYREFSFEDLVCAAYLHDTVEDTSTTLEQIEMMFGKSVAAIVDGVTRRADETYVRFIERSRQHPGSRMLKLADLHHNLQRINQLPLADRSIRFRYEKAVKVLNEDK